METKIRYGKLKTGNYEMPESFIPNKMRVKQAIDTIVFEIEKLLSLEARILQLERELTNLQTEISEIKKNK